MADACVLPVATILDRPARIRQALRTLVAERGFHGASMSAIARAAGVAAGTAYVHYSSKQDIVIDAYVEAKRHLKEAIGEVVDPSLSIRDQFVALWSATHQHFRDHPDAARFLLQVDQSPFGESAHAAAMADHDPSFDDLLAELKGVLIEMPPAVLYELGVAPAVRLAAEGDRLSGVQVTQAAHACWRAISNHV